MSTQVESKCLGNPVPDATLDKSRWTAMQHTQYLIGLWDGVEGHPAKVRELPARTWVPNGDYEKLGGILSDHPEHNTSEMKERERAWEREHDARKFGLSS